MTPVQKIWQRLKAKKVSAAKAAAHINVTVWTFLAYTRNEDNKSFRPIPPEKLSLLKRLTP